jgi:hypothetical protein
VRLKGKKKTRKEKDHVSLDQKATDARIPLYFLIHPPHPFLDFPYK